jgi:hypothetical protein
MALPSTSRLFSLVRGSVRREMKNWSAKLPSASAAAAVSGAAPSWAVAVGSAAANAASRAMTTRVLRA